MTTFSLDLLSWTCFFRLCFSKAVLMVSAQKQMQRAACAVLPVAAAALWGKWKSICFSLQQRPTTIPLGNAREGNVEKLSVSTLTAFHFEPRGWRCHTSRDSAVLHGSTCHDLTLPVIPDPATPSCPAVTPLPTILITWPSSLMYSPASNSSNQPGSIYTIPTLAPECLHLLQLFYLLFSSVTLCQFPGLMTVCLTLSWMSFPDSSLDPCLPFE